MNIEGLSYANIESQPVHYDWGNRWDDGELKWEFWEVLEREEPPDYNELTCGNCDEEIQWKPAHGLTFNEQTVWYPGRWVHTSIDAASECDEAEPDDETSDEAVNAKFHSSWMGAGPEDGIEGPMMSYYYPLDVPSTFDPREAAIKLADLPLCVVQIDEEDYALALTGGGMDLTPQIVEAFIVLGFYPPFHFARDLPNMSRAATEDDKQILKACAETLEAMRLRVQRAMDRLKGNAEFLGLDPAEIEVTG